MIIFYYLAKFGKYVLKAQLMETVSNLLCDSTRTDEVRRTAAFLMSSLIGYGSTFSFIHWFIHTHSLVHSDSLIITFALIHLLFDRIKYHSLFELLQHFIDSNYLSYLSLEGRNEILRQFLESNGLEQLIRIMPTCSSLVLEELFYIFYYCLAFVSLDNERTSMISSYLTLNQRPISFSLSLSACLWIDVSYNKTSIIIRQIWFMRVFVD
jgi:hypothetical protein